METNLKEIYNEKNNIIKKKLILKKKMLRLIKKEKELSKNCNHEIVLIFDEHIPYKIGKMFECFCPMCSKKENISIFNLLENTNFKNSKIIDFTDYDNFDIIDTFEKMQSKIISQYNFYYNEHIKEEDIKNSLISIMDKSAVKVKKHS